MYLQLSAAMWSHYSRQNDECNRLFARRAHLSVLPPSWGLQRDRAILRPSPSAQDVSGDICALEHSEVGLWPQAKLSSDGWEGAVDRSDGGGAIYSPEICHAHTVCNTWGFTRSHWQGFLTSCPSSRPLPP